MDETRVAPQNSESFRDAETQMYQINRFKRGTVTAPLSHALSPTKHHPEHPPVIITHVDGAHPHHHAPFEPAKTPFDHIESKD